MRVDQSFLLMAVVLALFSGCTKKEKGPDWWYFSKDPPVIGPKLLNPKVAAGYEIKEVVSNQEMREALDGRVVFLTHASTVSHLGELYWLASYVAKPPSFKIPKSTEIEALTSEHRSIEYALFKWSEKKGLQLLAKEIDLYLPRVVFANPKALEGCPEGAPVVLGIFRQRYVVEAREWLRHKGSKVFGPMEERGICFEEKSNGFQANVIFEEKAPKNQGKNDVWVSRKEQKIYLSSARLNDNPYDQKLEKMIGRSNGAVLGIQSLDLSSKKMSSVLIANFGAAKRSMPLPLLNFASIEKGGERNWLGLMIQNRVPSLCRPRGRAMKNEPSLAVLSHQCSRLAGFPEQTVSMTVMGDDETTTLFAGTTSFKKKTEGPTPAKLYRLELGSTVPDLLKKIYKAKKEEQKGKAAAALDSKKVLGVVKKEWVAGPFYLVMDVHSFEKSLFVFDYVHLSSYGNRIYKVDIKE